MSIASSSPRAKVARRRAFTFEGMRSWVATAEDLVIAKLESPSRKDDTMASLHTLFDRVDVRVTNWMARFGIMLLRLSLGIVFFWFGVLKFFPGLSSAQSLATRTSDLLTFGLIPTEVSILVLASWECLIGIGLMFGLFMRATLLLLFLQMLGTITPVFLFPGEVFAHIPYAPTMEGQYIIKNIVLISAGLVIGATVRGAAVVADRGNRSRR